MKHLFSVLMIVIFILIGYVFYHDYTGSNLAFQVRSMPISPFENSFNIVCNDFTYIKMKQDPAVDVILDGKSFHINSFESHTFAPTYRLSDLSKLNTLQYAHIMVVSIPLNLNSVYDKANNAKLLIHYTNGCTRELALK